ncbi:hypothetical protein HIO72_09250 [Halomonas sp. PA5]|nr:hypothetical protein HIO72_09250 [Halomonas sp. PA5]
MLVQACFVLSLSLVHLFAGKLHYQNKIPRSAWLSFAGGVSVAYVFIHIFPELQEAQQTLGDQGVIGFIEHHAYLVALFGLGVFYGLECWAKKHRKRAEAEDPGQESDTGVFWIHIGAFALYNALIGYLLVFRETAFLEILFFFLAMGFHFLVNDHALAQHHRHAYLSKGRWVLSAAVVVGWGIGWLIEVSEAITSTLYALLAGGLVLNVMKEELPEERQSRFWPFCIGATLCSMLLIAI